MDLYFLFSIAVIVGGYVMAKISEYVVAKMGDYLVTPIGDFLVASVGDQLGYLFSYSSNVEDFRKHVEHLKTERDRVQKLVDDAEMSGEDILPIVQTWLTRVNNITEEARNFFKDEVQANTRCFYGYCPNLKLRYQQSKEAKTKTTEVNELKRDGKFDRVSCLAAPPERRSPDAEDFDSRKLVSKEIMEALKDDQINMIGIYGVGGVGKTTLVEAVRKQAKDDNLFDEVAMAVVSQTLSIRKIQGEIADMLGMKLDAESEPGRAGQLYARLEKKKRILVVLDDIWEEVRLEDIGIPFGAKHKGCKIVLTSRRLDVCNQMHTQRNFSIEVLPEQEAWNLFCKTLGDSFDSPDLHALAVQVAKECAGLPIAIVTLATALRNRSFSDWRDTANQLSKSIPSKKVFATLELSYNYLESEEAKSFFLLFCLFPEGCDIGIQDLWKYGMGLGLFQNVETVDEARERAVRLANDLKSSCLLLDGYSEEWVKIHDVVRDVGISIASRDKHVFLVRTGPGWKELPREDTFKRYTAISLKSDAIKELPDKLECPHLQILLLDFYHSSLQLSNNFFLRMENLKVLDMSAMHFSSLPSSLQYLKNLCTLCLDRCKLKDLSIIGELEKLEILSFAGSDMEELPKEIGNLSHLRLLDLRHCEKLTRIPPDVIRGLSQLEGLYMGNGFVKWEVERQGKERSNASLAELKDLRHLINLEINVPNADLWPEDLLFENLSRFQVSIGGFNGAPSDDFFYSISVTRMILFGERTSTINVFNTCSRSLRLKVDVSTPLKDGINVLWKASEDLRLMEMKGLKNVLYDLDTQQFQHLRQLHVKKCDDVEYIFNASDWVSHVTFPVLEKLDFHRLPNFKGIWHGQLPSGCFCNLRVVKVFGCKGLKNLFSHCIAKDLSKLVELDVRMCKIMEQIFGNEKEEAAVGNMEFPHLRSLKLLRLPKLRNFCSKMKDDPNTHTEQPLFHKEVALPTLEKLDIFNGGNFKEIWHPQFVAKSFPQLKSLHVASCKKVLNVIPFNLLPRLQGLERLFVTHCDSVEQIVEVGRLGVGEGHVTGMLSQLRKIVLRKLPKLEHMWWWDYPHGTFGFQNLTSVGIFECNSLKSLFSPSIACRLVRLQKLSIDSCEMMETIIAEEREGEENCIELIAFPLLSELLLKDLPKLMVFYTGRYKLGFLSLEALVIQGCAAMKTFSCRTPRPQIRETEDEALDESPEEGNLYISTQPLFNNEVTFPTLQTLVIWRVDNLEDIWHPRLVAESFCRLRVLVVRECHKLLNVVPSNLLKDLKNLEKVSVLYCDSVEIIFEIEGLAAGTRTLSQLTELQLETLPNLREICSTEAPDESLIRLQSLSSLYICKCDSLTKTFSASIAHGLAQLKEVDIDSCEMMEAIVVKEREEDLNPTEIIRFPQLHTLKLQTLPSLTSFHIGSCTLNWPSLKELWIIECPRMKSFTPKHSFLQNPQMNDDEFEEKPKVANSCVPIRPLFDKWVAFTNLEKLRILNMENLQELFHSLLPDESFCQLKRLEVKGCHKLSRVAPSNLLPRLKNLNELFVKECNSMKEIFEVEGLGGEGHISLFQLENMELCNLPNLRIFCSENYSFELPLLKRLKLEGCPKMQTFFSGSISTPKLCRITIEDGEKRWEGSLNGTIEHLFQEKASEDLQLMEMKGLKNVLYELDSRQSQLLKRLYVKQCDEVEYIFNASDWVSPVTFPVLEKLDLYRLPNLKGIWHGQLPSGCFCNLRVVKVYGCKGLKNLFSHCIAKDLSKLVELDVRMCKIMEQIFGNEKEEAAVSNMEFPHLRSLKLLGLPKLRNFCSKMKDDPNTHTEQPLFHKEVALPALEKLEIFNGSNFKEIWHPQFLAKSSQLKSLHVASCKKVLNVIPFNLLPRLQGLERLFVTHCDSVEQIVEVGRLRAGKRHVTGMLSQLRQIILGKLPKLDRMWWWDYPHEAFGFQNLIFVRIFKCNSLKNLFSPSIASRLVQLQELLIDSCEMMETIIAEEREEEGEENRIELIAFPQLFGLLLKDLPKLMVFYTGRYTLNFPSLKNLVIQGCPIMKTFSSRTPCPQICETKDEALDESPEEGNFYISTQPLFNNEVTFPTLKTLQILSVDHLEDIWHPRLPAKSFCQLRVLRVLNCHKLLNVVPSNLLKGLKNLEEILVRKCDSVEIIFEIEGLATRTRTLSQLTKLILEELPKLREIWSTEAPNESLISLQSLSSLHVYKCDSLRNIFSTSMAGGLVQLKEGYIFSCEMMEAIVVKEREGESIPAENIIVFPQLHTLHLHELPNLTTFYTGACTLKWPSLKELFIKTGPRMKSFASRYPIQQNLQMNDEEFGEKPEEYCNSCIPIRSFFEEWVTFPTLQILQIWGLDNLKEIWHPLLPGDSFCQLRDLRVYDCHKLLNVVPSNLMKDLKNLKEVSVLNCDYVEIIFEVEGLAAGTFSQLSILRLWKLPKLRDIWSTQDPNESLISLQSLSWLYVHKCGTLRNIFSPSIAGDLSQLKKVEIGSCEMMEAVVVTKREGESNPIEIIVFPRLHTLTLRTLPNLSSFYTGPSTLKLPSLKALQIVTCPRMKSFASRYPQMNDEEIEGKLEKGSSCIPIRPLFDERAAFTNLEKLCINIANLQEIFHSELPDGSFCQLKFFEVGGCHTLSRVAPSNLLPRLKNLQKLSVKECGSMKEIFEVEGLVGEGDISLIQLEEVELHNLSDLSIFCLGNYNFELPSLRRLILEECPKMQTFTSGTLSIPKLNTIKVKDDEELWEGGLNRTVELLFQKKFKEPAQAYEVLSDPEKREIYDQYGEDALKEGMDGGPGAHDPFDIFSSFFRGGSLFGGGGSSRGRRQRRGEDVIHPLKVSLDDLYIGTLEKFSLSRNMICSKCSGKGSKSGASMKCSGCQGSGIKVLIRNLGPSMIQQMQHPCNECKGTGETINYKDRCPQCKGEKVVQEKKVLEVIVEKGMQNRQKITFPGEAAEAPDTVTGDIVFVLQQKAHPKFKRKGDDLFVEHTLSLTEALSGFQFVLTHLDGRQLLIKSNPGEVVKPDQYKAINDEGMPMYQRPFMKGKLYIHFTVDFPDSLSPDQCKALVAVLPPKTSSQLTDMELDECEETTLHDVNIEEEMRRKQSQAQEAYDEDEEMPGGAQRVQCAQQ